MSEKPPRLTFPQSRRLKSPAEFERCFSRKRSASDGVLLVYACANDLNYPRLGCSVSKRLGNAVARNRYKRLLREAFRLLQHELPTGVDLVVVPRPGDWSVEDVQKSLLKLSVDAARRLKPEARR